MPEEIKKPSEKLVDIDTSGPETDVAVEEVKEEAVIETKEEELPHPQFLFVILHNEQRPPNHRPCTTDR